MFRPEAIATIQCEVFDTRCSASVVAICVPFLKTLYLYRTSTEPAGEGFDKLICRPLRQCDSVAISPVLSTRKGVVDLLSLTSDGSIEILSGDGQRLPVALSYENKQTGTMIEGIYNSSNSEIELVTRNMPTATTEYKRLNLALHTRQIVVDDVLKTLAGVLPGKQFMEMYASFLANKQEVPEHDIQSELRALLLAMLPSVTVGMVQTIAKEVSTDWEDLLQFSSSKSTPPPSLPRERPYTTACLPFGLLEISLFSLRLLSEEWKLLTRRRGDVILLNPILVALAQSLGALDYLDASMRDGGSANSRVTSMYMYHQMLSIAKMYLRYIGILQAMSASSI